MSSRRARPTGEHAEAVESLLLGLVPTGEWEDPLLDLSRTPHRIAAMYRDELLAGYQEGAEERLVEDFTMFSAGERDVGMVSQRGVPFASVCAHHLQAFEGVAHYCYLPNRLIVGLSKIPRVIDHFSAMLQVQERIGEQVARFVEEHLQPTAFILVLESEHKCMSLRGVKKPGVSTRTAVLRGTAFSEQETRDEMYRLMGL